MRSDYSDGSYQFDTRVVWKHSSGAFYTARDSGCSCPTPFEDYKSIESLERLDLNALREEITEVKSSSYRHIEWGEPTNEALDNFLRKVEEAINTR